MCVCVCVCVCVHRCIYVCVCVCVCEYFFYDFLPLFVHCVFFKCVNAHVCASPRRQNHGSVFGAVFCYLSCARRLFQDMSTIKACVYFLTSGMASIQNLFFPLSFDLCLSSFYNYPFVCLHCLSPMTASCLHSTVYTVSIAQSTLGREKQLGRM